MRDLGLGIVARAHSPAPPAGVGLDYVLGHHGRDDDFHALQDIPGWTFSRASTATAETAPGVIEHYAADVPRIVPGRGLLLEPAATNLCIRSQEFDHAAWSKSAAGTGVTPVVVANDATAPDGTMTADKVTLDLNGGTAGGDRSMLFSTAMSVTATANYTGSVWVKGEPGKTIIMRHVGASSYTVHTFNGEWERIVRTEAALTALDSLGFGLRGGFGASDAAVFWVWGAQLEAGAEATSYVPTEGAAATRAQDQAWVDGLEARLSEPWTVLVELEDVNTLRARYLATVSADGATADQVSIRRAVNGNFTAAITADNEVEQLNLPGATVAGAVKAALAFDGTSLRWAVNGAMGPEVTPDGPFAEALSRLHPFGATGTESGAGVFGRRAVLLPYAVSNAGLEAMSQPIGPTWVRRSDAAFSKRDSANSFVVGGWRYIAGGYDVGNVALKDIWRTADGLNYELVAADPDYEDWSHVHAVGGVIYAWRTRMSKSTDGGETWTEIIETMPFVAPFDNAVWVAGARLRAIGGDGSSEDATAGVWEFDPVEEEWTLLSTPDWAPRAISVVCAFRGRLWLQGGYRIETASPPEIAYPAFTTLNDLWVSDDQGETWTEVVAELPCAARMWPALVAFGGHMYLLGGFDNRREGEHNFDDTWRSADGLNWRQVETKIDFVQRHAPVAYTLGVDPRLFLVSGNANNAAPGSTLKDIWEFRP